MKSTLVLIDMLHRKNHKCLACNLLTFISNYDKLTETITTKHTYIHISPLFFLVGLPVRSQIVLLTGHGQIPPSKQRFHVLG